MPWCHFIVRITIIIFLRGSTNKFPLHHQGHIEARQGAKLRPNLRLETAKQVTIATNQTVSRGTL